MSKFIHLLYVPTMDCNMQCTYCYLGDQTVQPQRERDSLATLTCAVDKLRDAGVVPFNISLHGGEVTTLPKDEFRRLVQYISGYYREYRPLLQEFGFRSSVPHIKTNLFGLDRHIEAIRDFNVSVSGSLDLPLSMHSLHRLDKGGHDTLPVILRNVQMLAELPNHKKVSATIFHEHMEHMDEIIQDLRWLHENTCLDMNDFNFMFGFAVPEARGAMTPLTREEQVAFYQAIHQAFDGTDLQEGMDKKWFAEFTPDYCTGCTNCGEKFFLLERNGDVYSCVRGQGHPEFRYGNIFENTVEEILARAASAIAAVHADAGFDAQCASCPHLHLCKTGCPFVKHVTGEATSYTCLLQQELYRHMELPEIPPNYAYEYLSQMHPDIAPDYDVPPDTLRDGTPSLPGLIRQDPRLAMVYDPDAFILRVDGQDHPLHSQLLKHRHETLPFVSGMTELTVYVRRDVLEELCPDPVNNALYIMLLSGDMVVYGDEHRQKQAHVMTHMVYQYTLQRLPSDRDGYYQLPLTDLISMYTGQLGSAPANLFFTTTALRDYHYLKQKNNGYYHAQAMNLPFQNIELACIHIPGMKGRHLL